MIGSRRTQAQADRNKHVEERAGNLTIRHPDHVISETGRTANKDVFKLGRKKPDKESRKQEKNLLSEWSERTLRLDDK